MPLFPTILRERLWHSTSPERYERICETGAILPEPDLPDKFRQGTACGPDHYPYVRHLGGISLFDFLGFNEIEYARRCPMSNWDHFVPQNDLEGNKIWIEIDRHAVGDNLIPGAALYERWEAEKAYRHKLMPYIEAAHLGPLPLRCVSQALRYSGGEWRML